MADSTFEEAKRCPKCNFPGEDRIKRPARGLPLGTMVHTIYCMTKLCPWYDTCWMVQVNPDGSVPPPQDHTKSPKQYVGFEGHDQLAQELVEALKRQQEVETQPGGHGEIRNPNG